MNTMDDYWNHNTAYHRWILGIAGQRPRRDCLDVGCGDGLLVQRLAGRVGHVVGIDADPAAITRARARLQTTAGAEALVADFATYQADRCFDLIIFVASLHHLDLVASLAKARSLLRAGGDVLVVGLARNQTLADWAWAGLVTPWAFLASALHRPTADIGVRTAEPRDSLDQVRAGAARLLPGAHIRRGLYYRYRLRWTNSPAPRA